MLKAQAVMNELLRKHTEQFAPSGTDSAPQIWVYFDYGHTYNVYWYGSSMGMGVQRVFLQWLLQHIKS